jgi:hypothetical protein
MIAKPQQTVMVGNRPYKITIYQKSRGLWLAAGQHMGKPVEVHERTHGAAIRQWIEVVRNKGN